MITREIENEILESAKEYPIVTILGPRQSGKTTLAKKCFPHLEYFSFENPDLRTSAKKDPRGFLKIAGQKAILDEIQHVPELLSYLQQIVDENRDGCLYILTGSHQPMLNESISQSLPGRTAITTLFPLTLSESTHFNENKPIEDIFETIVKGLYPGIYENDLSSRRFYRSYLQTYVERDLRAMIQLHDLDRFQNFLTLLAGRIGQLINLSSMSNDIGVSSTSLRKWLNVLKASYIIIELPSYHENIRKRVVKNSKIYFTDTGLASFLLGIETPEQLKRDPLRGNLFENIVITDIYKTLLNRGEIPKLFFYRDSTGNEVDLVVKQHRDIVPIEIKSASTFSQTFLKGIITFNKSINSDSDKGIIIYNGIESFLIESIMTANTSTMYEALQKFNTL